MLGILLKIEQSPEAFEDALQAQLMDELRSFDGQAELRWMLPVQQGIRLLIRSGALEAECLAEKLRQGTLRRLGLARARVVDFEQWERDIDLAQQLLARDDQALRVVLAEHAASIQRSLATRFRGARSADDIDEALNMAACKMWNSIHTFDPDRGSLGAWFYKIAEREVLSGLRRYPCREYLWEYEEGHTPREPWGSTSHHGNAGLLKDLDEIIENLPRKQKAIVLADLAAGERADDESLAQRLKSSPKSVRVLRRQARLRIQRELRERGYQWDGRGADH